MLERGDRNHQVERRWFLVNKQLQEIVCFTWSEVVAGLSEELSAGQPKRLILQSNHGLTKSPRAALSRSRFVEKAGREWMGRLESSEALGWLELCPKYVYEFRTVERVSGRFDGCLG